MRYLVIYLFMCLFKVVQVGTIDNLQFTIAYYCNNNLFRLYKWVQSRMQQFYKWVLLHKTWLFYKWVLQQQRFILVVQLGTIEKLAVLQVSITAQ